MVNANLSLWPLERNMDDGISRSNLS